MRLSSASLLAATLSSLFAVGALMPGCGGGERFRYEARNYGPSPERPLERPDWPDALQARCAGDPEEGDLLRQPYLQQTAVDSTMVLWRSEGEPLETVRYWPVDREAEVRVVNATPDRGAWGPRSARLELLDPGATHCYQLERAGDVVAGPFAFETAPPDLAAPVDLIALGDSGTGWEEQAAVFEQMRTVRSDLIVHTGDVAYPSGTDAQFQANVFDVYAPLLRSVPFFPSLGNHDLETKNGAPLRRAFELPSARSRRDTPLDEDDDGFYSFDWGAVHFVALNSADRVSRQVRRLDQDLQETTEPWVVVYMHHPPYSSGKHGSSLGLREALAPVLRRHRVPLVLSGHDHHYERSVPIEGTVYVVTGGGGRQITRVTPQGFTAHADSVLHFVHVHFEGREAWFYAIDGAGNVFDSTVLRSRR